MSLINLSLKSILSRKLVSSLLIISIAISTTLLIGIEKVKHSTKHSFSHSISGTDLIIGSKTSDIQLLMYTLFRVGQPVANISWSTFNNIKSYPEVAWAIPISLGDSHKEYPVVGTNIDYFTYYKFGRKKSLHLKTGFLFNKLNEVVLGYEVAKQLNYQINDVILLSHGVSGSPQALHKENTFKVVGILKATGTPVDKTVHISLEAMTALHSANKQDLTPTSITSCLIGLKSKFSLFTVQNRILKLKSEPLIAVIPGVALSKLWNNIRFIDSSFFIITLLVTVIAFLGLLLSLFLLLNQRKKELSILRSLGAHPVQISLLLITESLIITVSGTLLGLISLLINGILLGPILEEKTGLILSLSTISTHEITLSLAIILFGGITSLIPGYMIYKRSLSKGFSSI